jgi:ADP-ribosylglycohydrolase
MFGAIVGDVIGSVYEAFPCKHENFQLFSEKTRFTDDTVLTIAVADAYMNDKDYATTLKQYARKFPLAGFGGSFVNWVDSENMTGYGSYGNGSAMRVSSLGWLCNSIEDVIREAKKSAEVTHNHPEGIKGAQAIASAVFLARQKYSKSQIKFFIEETFKYDLNRKLDDIRPTYDFDVSCQGSVPESIIAFLESKNFEDCIRKAISIGGDSDTIAAMAGSIAEAFYKDIPEAISVNVFKILKETGDFTINKEKKNLTDILVQFYERL